MNRMQLTIAIALTTTSLSPLQATAGVTPTTAQRRSSVSMTRYPNGLVELKGAPRNVPTLYRSGVRVRSPRHGHFGHKNGYLLQDGDYRWHWVGRDGAHRDVEFISGRSSASPGTLMGVLADPRTFRAMAVDGGKVVSRSERLKGAFYPGRRMFLIEANPGVRQVDVQTKSRADGHEHVRLDTMRIR